MTMLPESPRQNTQCRLPTVSATEQRVAAGEEIYLLQLRKGSLEQRDEAVEPRTQRRAGSANE